MTTFTIILAFWLGALIGWAARSGAHRCPESSLSRPERNPGETTIVELLARDRALGAELAATDGGDQYLRYVDISQRRREVRDELERRRIGRTELEE